MALLNFRRKDAPETSGANAEVEAFLKDYSIEVMPRTAEKVDDFRHYLPAGTRVYVAHIDGTEISDMVRTAARLRAQGYEPMPHFPARSIPRKAVLQDWIARYRATHTA